MTYVEGFVLAVPANAKDAYRDHAADAVALFKEFGVRRHVECWGDDVPVGKVNDFRTAVQAKEGEEIVFSWFEYPDRAARDAATEKMMSDPRMQAMGAAMPFDGQRMIVAGFTPILDEAGKQGSKTGYVDGFLAAVPAGNKQAYLDMAKKAASVFKDYGAVRIVETWGDTVPDGKVTDYKGAVKATQDEKIVYSWVEWPSKEVRDEGWKRMMEDQRMKDQQMPFDGKRMVYGGFAPILDV